MFKETDIMAWSDAIGAGPRPRRTIPGRGGLTVLGLILLLGGVLAFFSPFAASLSAAAIAGAAFLMAGLAQLWLAFGARDVALGGRALGALSGLVFILFALALFVNTGAGLAALAPGLAALLGVLGALRVVHALRLRPRAGWIWIAASGALSLLLAVAIGLGLPGRAAVVPEMLLAIDLAMAGFATLALAWQEGNAETEPLRPDP